MNRLFKKIIISVCLFFTTVNAQTNGLVFGKEYLSHFHRTIMNGNIPKVVFSGDSTTEGAGINNYYQSAIQLAFRTIVLQDLPSVESINAGHSGLTIHQWVTNFIHQDLAQRPNLYILRWGLNPNTESTFETDLRTGLQLIRSQFPVQNMSIVLMTPNCCNDDRNGRGMKYLSELNPVVRQAARDFKCLFIDLTNMFPDAYCDPTMMDDPFGDGRRIHPSDVFNQMIASVIAENVLPKGIVGFTPARLSIQKVNGVDIVIQSGSGSCVIEKSYDLINWIPQDAIIIGNLVHYRSGVIENNAFFRLRR